MRTIKNKQMISTNSFLLTIITLTAIIVISLTGCDKKAEQEIPSGPVQLTVPANVSIDVTGRAMTVTWNKADNALGYEVVTTSVGCTSGNRTVNTKEKTSVITSSGNAAANVKIEGETSVVITLMAASGNPNTAMASAVTAKVMALGGDNAGKTILDSDYSETVRITIQK